MLLSLLFAQLVLQAQDYTKLGQLKGHQLTVFYSPGYQERADSISNRVDKAFLFYQKLLQTTPVVSLLVLSETDWQHYTNMPVFGMPHYKDDKVLVVAAHDNAFWQSFIPPLNQLPPSLAGQVSQVYRNSNAALSMQPFFDLLALHELGHAFHFQAKLNMQRNWLQELFVNMLLHCYVAEMESQSLPALTVFPQMVISSGSSEYLYTSLKDVHEKYAEIGAKYPKNYGWYQCRWHAAAAAIYDADKSNATRLLWKTLKSQQEKLNDSALIPFFEQAGLKSVAAFIRNWDAGNKAANE